MQNSKFILPQGLLHGGDYNPDQWLDRPDILAEDIELMKKAHVNCVSLGIFAWSRLEPEEGVYDFDWLEEIIDNLYENGIYTILATPTAAMPHWLTEKYEEVRKVTDMGVRKNHGHRHNFCPSSPVMREKMRAIDTALSARFGRKPGLVAWHLSNEYGGDNTGTPCHCPYCQENFRKWLKNRYKTLDDLNHAWWASFWSNTFTDWDQIHSPGPISEARMHGIKLDWKRFSSEQLMDFCAAEVEAVRTNSDAPTVVNMMGTFEPLDYFKWGRVVDIVSLDNYPYWGWEPSDLEVAAHSAFANTLTRSFKKQPFLLMESTPSVVNWAQIAVLKRPGMHMLASMQSIAHGADSVQYFQWRKSRGSSEKFHGAVVGHMYKDNTRVFRDVEEVGARLQKISDRVKGTCNRPKAAIVFDWENGWAVDDAQAVVHGLNYRLRVEEYYRAFWELGIDVDVIDMDDPLTDYSLIVAPINHMYRGDYIENVKRFVENGGVYLTTYWSGEVDTSDLCFLDKHPLQDVLGIRPQEIDVSPYHVENKVSAFGREYAVKQLCALVETDAAEVLGTYEKDFYAGYPALTGNAYGSGKAFYIAAECELNFIKDVYSMVLKEAGIACDVADALPACVTVAKREGAEEKDALWFVQNFNPFEATLDLKSTFRNAETGECVSGSVTLTARQCLILERA